jgi:hypothetical protein
VLDAVLALRSITPDVRQAGVWTGRLKIQRTTLKGVSGVNALLGLRLLGEHVVIVAFPVERYLPAKGASDPIYFPERLVEDARGAAGFLIHLDDRDEEVARAFQGPLLMDYLSGHLRSVVEVEAEMARGMATRVPSWRRPRSPLFTASVLEAYKSRCALCGMQMGIVEAAHLVPHALTADDSVANGIALCPNHHTAFDLASLIAIAPDRTVLVNETKLTYLAKHDLDGGRASLLALRKKLVPVALDQATYLGARFEMISTDGTVWKPVTTA